MSRARPHVKGQNVTASTRARIRSKPQAKPVAPAVDVVEDDELDFDAQLDGAALPQDDIDICLRGDLIKDLKRLDLELVALMNAGDDRMAPNPRKRELADEIEAVRHEMKRYTRTFTLQGLPQPDFTRMQAEHPPRPDNEADAGANANIDTMTVALVRAAIIKPRMTDARWEKFVSKLVDGQWDDLGSVAWALNRTKVKIPFSRAASIVLTSEPE
jgi:hypothetical protein